MVGVDELAITPAWLFPEIMLREPATVPPMMSDPLPPERIPVAVEKGLTNAALPDASVPMKFPWITVAEEKLLRKTPRAAFPAMTLRASGVVPPIWSWLL